MTVKEKVTKILYGTHFELQKVYEKMTQMTSLQIQAHHY